MKHEITDTPDAAVTDGKVAYGWFRTPFTRLNLLDCDNWGWDGRSPRALRDFRLKEWQHLAILHEDVYVSIALVDAKFTSNSWVCVFDRKDTSTVEHSRVSPLRRIGIPPELWDGRFEFRARGYRVGVRNHLDELCHEIDIDVKKDGSIPAMSGRLHLGQDPTAVQPLISVLPITEGSPFYSHKAPCPVSGTLNVGGRIFEFDPERDLALMDVHKAFYPRRTFWKWATFAFHDESGRIAGVNLTRNVIDDEEHGNENAIWCGDRLSLVGPARFEVPSDVSAPWRIRTTDQRVELEFRPIGMRREDIRMVVAQSRYVQPFGTYHGFMVDDAGERIVVNGEFGIAEDHYVVW